MILKILKQGSELCGNCEKYDKENCQCICHKEALFSGYHESSYSLPIGKVEDVTEFDDGDKIL